jgi:oligopeptide transport system substrate-binding protein
VTGGRFSDLPYARAAKVSSAEFRVDPAYGLFGLAITSRDGPLATSNVRRALAMAIDREALVRRFGINSWRPVYAVLPAQMDGALSPAALDWVQLSLDERRARARTYLGAQPPLPTLRLWLPQGPGARLLFASLSADWASIGVKVERVAARGTADFVLIDEVAPQSSALWYFDRLSCARGLPCSKEADVALDAVVAATTLEGRAKAIAEADAAYASNQGYIPLALPLRWSLVAPRLTGWQPSAFAIHPLQRLRGHSGN